MNTKRKATNPIKQNTRLKEYIGWCTVFLFPFALLGVTETTRVALAAFLIYIGFNGFFLRSLIDNKFPYFEPKFKNVFHELLGIAVALGIAAYMLFARSGVHQYSFKQTLMIIIFFVIIRGIFEQLISVNIFDLVGCKIKFPGYIAVILNTVLMYILFWDKFIIISTLNSSVIIVFQCILTFLSINIYHKTKDITICSVFQILFNVIIVFSCGFNINLYLAI